MRNYCGILIKEGLKDPSILEELNILGTKQGKNGRLLRIGVEESEIRETVRQIQEKLVRQPAFYAHFYKDDDLIVVFPERVIHASTDKATWGPIIEYGRSVGIPERELDFKPCRPEDETF